MGCDIHSFSEVRTVDQIRDGNNKPTGLTKSEWVPADPWGIAYPKYGGILQVKLRKGQVLELAEPEDGKNAQILQHDDTVVMLDSIGIPSDYRCDTGRNYYFFSALNGVRTEANSPQFFQDREWPEDVSAFVKKWAEPEGGDWHSHCWATLRELKEMREWAKQQKVTRVGFCDASFLDDLKAKGESYEKINGPSVKGDLRWGTRADGYYKVPHPPNMWWGGSNHAQIYIEWERTIYDDIKHALEHMIAALEYRKANVEGYRAQEGGRTDDDVRVLWYYDN